MGRAFSEVISTQLTGASGLQAFSSVRLHSYDRLLGARPVSAPGISTERTEALLAGAARIMYGEYTVRMGKLEASVTVEDPRAARMVRTFTVSAPAGDVLGAASAIARQIDPKATAYLTRSGEALADYIRALESSDAGVMEKGLSAAIAADPDFPSPYGLLAQVRAQRGDTAGASAVVEQALSRGSGMRPVDRARLELEGAEIARDLNARYSALLKLVQLDPSDPTVWRAIGESALNRHDYKRAMEAYQKTAGLEPNDAATWNALGYAATYAGDLDAGTSALRRYQALAPADANPLDSLGDIYFASGKLAEAEKFYLEAYQKDPNFNGQGALLKCAMTRLYAGDIAAADQAANRYFDARSKAKDPILDYRRAQWMWLTGRRKEGYRQMQAFADAMESSSLRDAASRADAELALWSLMMGDRNAATQLSAKAVRIASPESRGNAIVAEFLAMPPASSSEWTVRSEQNFGGPGQNSIRSFALGYALLVNREFQPAQLVFKEMWESGAPIADEGLPVMLAWTLLETGRQKDAAPLLRFNPVPNANGLTPYASFYLPRLFYLRGKVAEKESRAADASVEFKKFLALSGSTPLIWNETEKARE